MSPLRAVLCAVLTLGLVLGPGSAEARFGKSSDSSSQDTSKKKDTHGASAVGEDDDDDDDRRRSDRPRQHTVHLTDVGDVASAFIFIFGGNHRMVVAPGPGPEHMWRGERHAAPLSFRLGLQGGPVNEGAAVDAFIGLEGRRFGVDARLTGMGLDAEDGSSSTDTITLMEAHLTWALISLPHARLRAEAGLSQAMAPDITFLGPSLGMSFEACVAGPLDFESRMQLTPFPYRQVDASAALALHLGALVLRGGYRGLVLDDAGHVDGVRHVDTLHGPYFGLGLTY